MHMSEFVIKYKNIWGDEPANLLDKYTFQTLLTAKLDNLNASNFSRQDLYEIVLWKVNRFPEVDDALLDELKELSGLENGQHKTSEGVLKKLLCCKGIALPMASTILRFINPAVFQIIDDRAYRVLLPGKKMYPSKPQKITDGFINNSCSIYYNYLDEINKITSEKLPFSLADRILYQLDIELGNKIGGNKPVKKTAS